MTHFDIPVESYFPWYTYSTDMSLPILDLDMYRLFSNALPFNSYLWHGDSPEIQSTQIKMPHDNIYLTFESRKKMAILGGSFSHVFTVDSWLEMEKHRLFYLMGTKEKSLNYIKTISILMNLYEIIDYSITEMKDDLIYDDGDILISSFKNIEISEVDLKLTDVELINIIKNYDGINSFFNSLKMYYNKYLILTTKQMESARKTIQRDDCMKKFDNEICIIIKEKKKSEKHTESLIYRLEKVGYRSLDYKKNQKIIFKL